MLHNRFVLLGKWILTVLTDDVSCYSLKESGGPWMKSVSRLRGEESNKRVFFFNKKKKKADAFCRRKRGFIASSLATFAVGCVL